jgi:hypothetical protein
VPFEPLHTDEKIDGKKVREKSMDDVMITGCTGFVGCSVGTFLLGVWPFLVFGSAQVQSSSLLLGFPLGLLPAWILGAIVSRKYGLAAACGFIGGAMALGVFMFLVSNRLMTAIFLASGPRHFYSPVVVYLIPVAWLVICLAIAYVFLPKSELRFWKP